MSAFIDFLGEKLSGPQNTTVETTSLDSVPVVALYFSAHWCPPCKMFTGKLKKFYNEVNANSKKLEIVWISGDQDEEEYDDYFEDMPWIAMPFELEDEREDVNEKFDIASIPQLIVLNKDGTAKTKSGKKEVEDHGVGAFNNWM